MKNVGIWTVLAVLSLVSQVQAGHHCCSRCGCQSPCKSVCRLVPTTTQVKRWVYCYECEDFCVNGRSCYIGDRQVCDCRGSHCEAVFKPTCDRVMTRKILTKKQVVEEKEGWKCVVEKVCCGCGHCETDAQATAEMERLREEGQLPALYAAEQTVNQTAAEESVDGQIEGAVQPIETTSRPASGLMRIFFK
jgi:hypothetical protein